MTDDIVGCAPPIYTSNESCILQLKYNFYEGLLFRKHKTPEEKQKLEYAFFHPSRSHIQELHQLKFNKVKYNT